MVRAAAEWKFRVHGWRLIEHRRTRLHHAAAAVVAAARLAGHRGVLLRPTLPISRDGEPRSAHDSPAWLYLAGQCSNRRKDPVVGLVETRTGCASLRISSSACSRSLKS